MKNTATVARALAAAQERLAEVERERDLERESKANYDAAYEAMSDDQQEYVNRIEQYRSDNCYLEQRNLRLVRMLKEAGVSGDYFNAACVLSPSRVEMQRWVSAAERRAEQAERERDEAQERVRALEEALRKYGECEAGCPSWKWVSGDPPCKGPCTCGYEAALDGNGGA